jgi:hypothetical protein
MGDFSILCNSLLRRPALIVEVNEGPVRLGERGDDNAHAREEYPTKETIPVIEGSDSTAAARWPSAYFDGVASGGDVYVVRSASMGHTDEKCERILWNVPQPLASTGFPIWPSSGRAQIELHLTVAEGSGPPSFIIGLWRMYYTGIALKSYLMQLPPIPWSTIGRGLSRIRAWRRRPVLTISFEANKTYDVRAVIDFGGALGRFCHFIVTNTGKDAARNSRARLMNVEILSPHGVPVAAPGFIAPRELKWANEPDFGPRDIAPEVPRRVDLCYAVNGHQGLWFFAGPASVGVQTVFPPGKYRMRVCVDAQNARHVEASFDVSYDGRW